jgi:hypothetical protein
LRRLRPSWFSGVLVAAGLAAISGSALAYFTADGVGTASAAVSKLSAPTITAADAGVGGTVSAAVSAGTAYTSATATASK